MQESFDTDFLFPPSDLNICLFPHLTDVLVIDLRPSTPNTHRIVKLSAKDILTEEFYQSVQEEFSGLLKSSGNTLGGLSVIPQLVDGVLREQGLKSILRHLSAQSIDESMPEISVFVCVGPALSLTASEISCSLEHLFSEQPDPDTVTSCAQMLENLITLEKDAVRKESNNQRKQAVRGEMDNYYTLWQSEH
tara:strand:- start:1917 stop:2492 length:576 start_codon:yes stop_codon:yes gene_type:complete